MNSFVSDSSKQQRFRVKKNFLTCSPINIAVWHQERLSWAYPISSLNGHTPSHEHHNQMLTIKAINSTKEYEIIRIQLSNRDRCKQIVKVLVQHRNEQDQNATAFYSPQEKAVICCTKMGITMVGGNLEGTEMSQYSFNQYHEERAADLTKQLKKGQLPLSWIASGDVCSTFMIEKELLPDDEVNGLIWTFHSSSVDLIQQMRKEMLSSSDDIITPFSWE